MSKVLLYSVAAAGVSAFSSSGHGKLDEHHSVALAALAEFQDHDCHPSGLVTFGGPYTEIVFECGETEYEVDVEMYDGVLVAEYIEETISFSDMPGKAVVAAANAGVDPSKCGMYQISTEVATGKKMFEFDECDNGATDVEVDSDTFMATRDTTDTSHRTAGPMGKMAHVAVAIEAVKAYEKNECKYTGQYIDAAPYTEIVLHCGDTEWEADVEMYDGELVAEYLEKTIDFADMPADVVKAAQWVGADLSACGLHQWQIEPETGKVHYEFDACGSDGSIDIEVDADTLEVSVDVSDASYRASHYRKEAKTALDALSKMYPNCGNNYKAVGHDGPYIEFLFQCGEDIFEVDVELYDGVHVAEYIEKFISIDDIPEAVLGAAVSHASRLGVNINDCGVYQQSVEVATGTYSWEFDDCPTPNGGTADIEIDYQTLAGTTHLNDLSSVAKMQSRSA